MMDSNLKPKLNAIVDLLTEYGKGNFAAREEISDDDDEHNALISGLNMLGEELEYITRENIRQRDFLENILTSVNEMVYVRSVRDHEFILGNFSFLSNRAEKIIGYSIYELNSHLSVWIDSIHPEDRPYVLKQMAEIAAGRTITIKYRFFHKKHEEYIWLEDHIEPKRDNGVVVEVYGSARDITEKQKASIDLEEKNKLISQLIYSSDQAFYIISLDPVNSFINNCRYLSWQVEKIMGSSSEEIKANPFIWIKAIHPDDREGLRTTNRQMFATKKPVTRTYRLKHAKSGKYSWIEDYIVPIIDGGIVTQFYGSARDVTARKTIELEQEKLVYELNKKNTDLMQFSHIVSHNLRSPIASILGLSQLLTKEFELEWETTREYIVSAARSMDDLLHDLNDILSIQSSLTEEAITISLTKEIDVICMELQEEIKRSKATFQIQIAEDADELLCIESYLRGALSNLITNAIKYRAADRLPRIVITARRDGQHTIISIADNGVGINLILHGDKLFRLYSKLHTNRKGKGLGLYLTKSQIEAMDGKLTVDSIEGQGTTFTITL
jgi:PAS domain S-box-containing protein